MAFKDQYVHEQQWSKTLTKFFYAELNDRYELRFLRKLSMTRIGGQLLISIMECVNEYPSASELFHH